MTAPVATKALASIHITPGEHKIIWHICGLELHGDTIISTLIAGAIILLLGFFMRSRLSMRKPGKVQLFFETVTIRSRSRSTIRSASSPRRGSCRWPSPCSCSS